MQQTVPLPPVQGSVTLCVLTEDPAQCKTTPEPLAQGATLTVKAFGNRETTTEPSLSVVPATCPAGQSGTAIKVTTGDSQTDLVVEVSGTGATSLAPTKLVDQHNTGTSQTVPVVSACAGLALGSPRPSNTAAPRVTGKSRQGETLIAIDGEWNGDPHIERQWLRCDEAGQDCSAATQPDNPADSTYELTEEDVGYTIEVREVATNDGGTTTAQSEPTAVVQPTVMATVVTLGRLSGGQIVDLLADDNQYFEVHSTMPGKTKAAAWYGSFRGVPNDVRDLNFKYVGKSSRTCSHTLTIWRWTSSSWVTLDTRGLGTTEAVVQGAVAQAPADYVSGWSGSGEVRIGSSCDGRNPFRTRADLLELTFRPG